MKLETKYRREIEAWDWNEIVSEARANVETDFDGSRIGRAYLGSILSLSPSGKFYTPFAHSNVNPCGRCKGIGKNRHKKIACSICAGSGIRTAQEYMNLDPSKGGFTRDDGSPIAIGETFACNVCHGSGEVPTECRACGGLGSSEAYRDSVWNEVLEEIAGEHNGSVGSGDGDGCDLFFDIAVDDGSEDSSDA